MVVESVPIWTNPMTRPSRLKKSVRQYVLRSMGTIIKIFVVYRPFRFFAVPGVIAFGCGMALGMRFVFYFLQGTGTGKVQSLLLATLLMVIGTGLVSVGISADLNSVNRRLLEDIDLRLKRLDERLPKSNKGGLGPENHE